MLNVITRKVILCEEVMSQHFATGDLKVFMMVSFKGSLFPVVDFKGDLALNGVE